MNAGEVVVKLIADLKNFTGNLVKGAQSVKDFAKTTETHLSQADLASIRTRDAFGRFVKETRTNTAAAAQGVKSFSQETRNAFGLMATAIVRTPMTAFGEALGTPIGKLREFKNVAASVLTWLPKQVSTSFNEGFVKAAGISLSQAAGSVREFASGAVNALLLVPRGVMGAFQGLESLIGRIFSLKNIIIGGALALFVKQVMDVGVAAQETEKHFDLAFGEMSDSVRAWSEELGTQLKRCASDIRGAAADMNLYLKNVGLTDKASAELSKSLTELGYAAVASGRAQGSEAELIWAMQQALMGNQRAMRSYGVTVSDDMALLWAHQHGLSADTKVLNENQMAVAKAALMHEQLSQKVAGSNRTQGQTKILLSQLRDAWTEIKEKIADKWQPLIDKTIASLRDWLIANVDQIATWAEKLGYYVQYAGEVFAGFVKIMQQSPKQGFQALLDSLIAVIKAAGKIAIDLAIRIGKGIWQGVKESILSSEPSYEDLKPRAMELYKAQGGGTYTDKFANPDLWGGVRKRYVEEERPRNTNLFNEAMKQARREAEQARSNKFSEPLLAGFGDDVKDALSSIGDDLKESSTDFGKVIDEANANLSKNLDGITTGAKEAGAAGQQAGGQIADSMGRAAGATQDAAAAEAAYVKAFAEASARTKEQTQDIEAYIASLKEEGRILDLINRGLEGQAEIRRRFGTVELTPEEMRRATQEQEANRIKGIWGNATRSITSSFEDAFVSATKHAKNFGEYMQSLADSIQDAFSRAVFKSAFEKPIESFVGNMMGGFGNLLNPAPMAQGGLVPNPVYAAKGIFRPQGTDTVPAMLTPGELVVPKKITDWLKGALGGGAPVYRATGGLVYASSGYFNRGNDQVSYAGSAGGDALSRMKQSFGQPAPVVANRPIEIHVHAIDAAGTYQFLNQNKRAIASMVADAGSMNHPARRGL